MKYPVKNKFIKLLGIESGMTRKEFVEKVGISAATFTNMFNGKVKVMDKHIKPIADALGIEEKGIRRSMLLEAREAEFNKIGAAADADTKQYCLDYVDNEYPEELGPETLVGQLYCQNYGRDRKVIIALDKVKY